MNTTIDQTITVTIINGSTINIDPPSPLTVQDVDQDGTVEITWIPQGCQIDGISWGTQAVGAPPNPTQDLDSGNWSVSYPAPSTPMTWNYTIAANLDGSPIIVHDPEIDNVKP